MPGLVTMDFSGVYPMMDMPSGTVLDCTLVRGCMRYCDDQALKVLQDKIAGCPSCGIHFIDGGDYHYLTKLWTDTLKEPFSLVLLDHHPDMQPPLLDGMLSCGGWVLDMLDSNPLLDKVLVAGISPSLVPETLSRHGRVLALDERVTTRVRFREALGFLDPGLPVYISIDKDVLGPEWARTNWDQGTMSLALLEELLEEVSERFRILGADICGLDPGTPDPAAILVNSRTDREIAIFLSGILPV